MCKNSDYWDWYDNGPGSEKWKKELLCNSNKTLAENAGFIRSLLYPKKKEEKVIDLPEELFKI